MWLPSRLERSTLGDLLGKLHRGGVSGRLDVIPAELAPAAIHFDRGEVTRVDGAGPRLGERLARSPDERRRIEAILFDGREEDLTGAALARRGVASLSRLRDALESQARERLDKLFDVRRADLRFHVATGPSRGVRVALDPATYLHGRPRAVPRTSTAPLAEAGTPFRDALAALGIASGAHLTRESVRRAFRVRAAALHPDRARDPRARAVLARAFTDLAAAYERALAAC